MVINTIKLYEIIKSKNNKYFIKKENLSKIVEKCYLIFPIEEILINGNKLNKGMHIEIITNSNKKLYGEILGANENDFLCLLSNNCIIAQEIKKIKHIQIKPS